MSKVVSVAKTVGAVGVALLALSGAASAEDREFTWSVNAGGTSDYVFRGYSQSDEDPAFQAGVDVGYGILYAGVWGSNTDKDFTGSPAEVDFYGGIKPVLGPVTFDLGVIYYWYPGDHSGDADYVELKGGASITPVTNLSLGGYAYWTDEGTFNSGEIVTYEGNAGYTLPSIGIFTPTVSGVLGYVDYQDFDDASYTYWNAGLSLAVEKFTFDFRYWDTDVEGETLADERFVFSAKVALP